MVDTASPAPERTFSVREVLRKSRCYNVRKVAAAEAAKLVGLNTCSSAHVHVALRGKTSVQIRRELNKKLEAASGGVFDRS